MSLNNFVYNREKANIFMNIMNISEFFRRNCYNGIMKLNVSAEGSAKRIHKLKG